MPKLRIHPTTKDSTATVMQHPMFLIPLSTLLRLYNGKGGKILECHQLLKARGDLVKWETVKEMDDSLIIFVSHE